MFAWLLLLGFFIFEAVLSSLRLKSSNGLGNSKGRTQTCSPCSFDIVLQAGNFFTMKNPKKKKKYLKDRLTNYINKSWLLQLHFTSFTFHGGGASFNRGFSFSQRRPCRRPRHKARPKRTKAGGASGPADA